MLCTGLAGQHVLFPGDKVSVRCRGDGGLRLSTSGKIPVGIEQGRHQGNDGGAVKDDVVHDDEEQVFHAGHRGPGEQMHPH